MTPMELYMEMRQKALKCRAIDYEEKIRVVVQYSKCSEAAGAKDVLAALKMIIKEKNIEGVMVETTGCKGFCSYEPIMTIRKDGRKPVTYCKLTPDIARIALCEYVLRDSIIKPWILDGEGVYI